MGVVVPFKQKQVAVGYRVSFYTEEEINVTLACLNLCGNSIYRYNRDIMKQLDPLEIQDCLTRAKNLKILSTKIVAIINNILYNIEEFPLEEAVRN